MVPKLLPSARLAACAAVLTACYVFLAIRQPKPPNGNVKVVMTTETGMRIESLFAGVSERALPQKFKGPGTDCKDRTILGRVRSLFSLQTVKANHCSQSSCTGAYMWPDPRECPLMCSLQIYDYHLSAPGLGGPCDGWEYTGAEECSDCRCYEQVCYSCA